MTRSLSVIVPAHNASRTIERCVQAIRSDLKDKGELIVIDDASRDNTADLAAPFAHRLIRKSANAGDGAARRSGIEAASGEILLFVDSDVVVPPGTCDKILRAFESHPNVAAVTGRLSTERQSGFFTDYKNLYMNYILGRLPENVTFVYGSIFAATAEACRSLQIPKVRIGADTAIGLELSRRGMRVLMLKEVEVLHLKKYTARSFYRNDFMIPYGWTRLFRHYNGWKQLGRKGTGFAHSSKAQLTSLVVAWLAVVLALPAALGYCSWNWVALTMAAWLMLNARFLLFLFRRRGAWFGLRSVPVTFVDHLVMALGAGCGFINTYMKGK